MQGFRVVGRGVGIYLQPFYQAWKVRLMGPGTFLHLGFCTNRELKQQW